METLGKNEGGSVEVSKYEKPYEPPELIEYGTVDEITKGMVRGNTDGIWENGPFS